LLGASAKWEVSAAELVYLKGWSGLETPEATRLAAQILLDAGWIRELSGDPSPLGGRPSIRYRVNPKVLR
jgi:hypothetical protein